MMIKSLNIDPIVACWIFVDLRLLPLYATFFSINDCILCTPKSKCHAYYEEVSLVKQLVHDETEVPEASDKIGPGTAFKEDRTGRWARKTFKIVLSYHGTSFDGWQKQPSLNTVQGCVLFYLSCFPLHADDFCISFKQMLYVRFWGNISSFRLSL